MSQNRQDDFGQDFHDRLSTYWPEPRDQLHHGGWKSTKFLIDLLNPQPKSIILDLCCGEGGTANWLGKEFDFNLIGLDIVEKAILTAHENQSELKPVDYMVADGFHIPLKSSSIDSIVGQDPDVFGYQNRVKTFAECYRVLRPNGKMLFHHYVIHDDAPNEIKARFNQINAELGFKEFTRLTIENYSDDLVLAEFKIVAIHDMSDIYYQHITSMADIANKRGEDLDTWTSFVLELMNNNHKIGAMFEVQKLLS